ncbi:MAG: dephospho-CoA kinase [Actinobacteria bacterium]|uniref:Unannotated protein n=1 Tax=freshwater metagenome TaxID=449393 RepID=A0A6J6A2R1_9ZZZZ|nr:dephospho-CoA kinase [Actinomycetota bacterium]
MTIDAAQLAAQAAGREPRAGATRVVAIDGPAGSGKTTLAALLAAEIPDSLVLNTDALYHGWDGLEEGARRLVREVLEPLAEGAPARFTAWDWQQEREGAVTTLPACATLIIDGAGSGSEAAAPFVSFLIWVDADPPTRRSRAIARDGEMFAPHWERWAQQEQLHFAAEATRTRADLVIETTGDQPQSSQ